MVDEFVIYDFKLRIYIFDIGYNRVAEAFSIDLQLPEGRAVAGVAGLAEDAHKLCLHGFVIDTYIVGLRAAFSTGNRFDGRVVLPVGTDLDVKRSKSKAYRSFEEFRLHN